MPEPPSHLPSVTPPQSQTLSPAGIPPGIDSGAQLNFHQLYIFFAAASHGSFSRAAEALAITQPAVSIQIQELEKSMGVTLLHRRSRGVRVTEIGETVYAYAQQIFSLSGKLLETVQELEDLKSGHLTVGASTTPGEFIMPSAIGGFRQAFPGIQAELIIGNTRTIVRRLLTREMDLGMIGERPEEHSADLEMVHYCDDEIVLVASPADPISRGGILTPAQVVEHGIIVREQGSATRQAAESHLAVLGVETRPVLELGSNQAVKQAAAAGGGIGVISRLGIAAEVHAHMLVVLEVEGWNCRRPLTLVYPKDRYLSPVQRAFREYLLAQRPQGEESTLRHA